MIHEDLNLSEAMSHNGPQVVHHGALRRTQVVNGHRSM